MNDTMRLSRIEYIAMMAMLFATIAFSIDAMLPALPEIVTSLTPEDPNRAQMVVVSFMLGLGVGTFFTGPISDAVGRKPVILGGAILYIGAAILAYFADSIEVVLFARVIQGLGAAAPRIVGLAATRDLFEGREMAQIVSFTMMVFTLVPAAAPLIGSGIMSMWGWRAIFLSFIVFSVVSSLWVGSRLPETLPSSKRRPLRFATIWAALKEMASHPTVRLSILAQTLTFAILLMHISLVHPVFDKIFDRAEQFPYWFGGMALLSGSASFLNARLVMRLGMRKMATIALAMQAVAAIITTVAWLSDLPINVMFYVYILWATTVFFGIGLSLGNLNSITMEPMGHIAGTAASVAGGVSTVLAALIAAPVGLIFNGTILPLSIGAAVTASLAWFVLRVMVRSEAREET